MYKRQKLTNKKIIIKEALANGRVFPNDKYINYKNAYQLLSKLASKYNVGIDAIALRFCIDSFTPYRVLSGVSEVAHLTTNLEAANIKLSISDLNQMKELSVLPSKYWLERKELDWQ